MDIKLVKQQLRTNLDCLLNCKDGASVTDHSKHTTFAEQKGGGYGNGFTATISTPHNDLTYLQLDGEMNIIGNVIQNDSIFKIPPQRFESEKEKIYVQLLTQSNALINEKCSICS